MRIFLLVSFASLVISCQQTTVPDELIGNWRGTSMQVLDSIWQVEVDPIQLSVTPDLRYTLNWYGGAIESGTISSDGTWMHIVSNDGTQRKIRILYLGADTLSISGPINDQRMEIGFIRLVDQEAAL